MWKDEIVEEIHQIRDNYAKSFNKAIIHPAEERDSAGRSPSPSRLHYRRRYRERGYAEFTRRS